MPSKSRPTFLSVSNLKSRVDFGILEQQNKVFYVLFICGFHVRCSVFPLKDLGLDVDRIGASAR